MTTIIIFLCITGIFLAGYLTAGIFVSDHPEEYYAEGFHDGYHKALNDIKNISKEGE